MSSVRDMFHAFLRCICFSYFSTTRCGIERSSRWVGDPLEYPTVRHLICGCLLQLGVTFQLVERGVDNACFEQGLESWRARHPEPVLDAVLEATASFNT